MNERVVIPSSVRLSGNCYDPSKNQLQNKNAYEDQVVEQEIRMYDLGVPTMKSRADPMSDVLKGFITKSKFKDDPAQVKGDQEDHHDVQPE